VSGAGQPSPEAGVTTGKRTVFALLATFAAGVLTFFPALRSPYLLDDYLHQSMVDGNFPCKRGPFDLYDFVNDADRTIMIERGILPWWADPELKVRFFRPLSSLLLWIDHAVAGTYPFLLHLHSLAWWVAAVLAVRALFRHSFSPRVALLAMVIYALAPCHTLPLAWLANREVLVCITFGTLALTAYVRFREGRSLRHAAAATALFFVSMLGGEYALAFGGYVLAIELGRAHESLGQRMTGMLPFAVPAAGYLLVRGMLHYGTAGSGFYSDPLSVPGAYLATAPRRLLILLEDAWFSIDATTWSSSTPFWLLAAILVVGAAGLARPMRRVIARLEPAQRATATWMLRGSVIALLPTLAVVPSARLLGVSYLGVSALVALLLDHAWFPAQPEEGKGELLQLAAILLGFAHLVHGPATSWLVGRQFRDTGDEFSEHTKWFAKRLSDPENADVVLVRGLVGQFFVPFALDPHGKPPKRWRILTQTGHILLLRTDARSVRLTAPKDQSLFTTGPGNLFRSLDRPFRVGDEVRVPGMHVTIEELGEDGPRQALFEFDEDIEASKTVWFVENYDGFKDANLPTPGFGKPFDP